MRDLIRYTIDVDTSTSFDVCLNFHTTDQSKFLLMGCRVLPWVITEYMGDLKRQTRK